MLRTRRFLALGLVWLMVILAVVPVWADELEEQQQQIQQQMRAQQKVANHAQQKVDSVSEQLRLVQVDLDAAEGDYKTIQSQLQATEQQIEVNTEILAKAEKNLTERSQILNKRVRDIYQNGQISYLDVLLGANDFSDFSTRMEILKRVISKDIELITRVKAERALVLQKRSELEQNRADIIQLKQAAEEKKKLIEVRKHDREKVLNAAVSERDTAEQAYQELLDTSRRIEQMIRRNQSGKQGAIASSGAMMWPTNGEITSPFGWRTHPIFGTARYHSGIDIGADYGDPIAAADSGVVIYADWMGGYGNAVIIDHGGSISTLYAHNSQLLVSEGQRVYKGQTIAYAGSTGYSTGPHLHFEVRENGSPVNPLGYLP